MTPLTIATVGALYPGGRRGITADVLAAYSQGAHAYPVCTALAISGQGVVTDFTEVPEDTVRAQMEHLAATSPPSALKISVLASHQSAAAVLDTAQKWGVLTLLDLNVSGPNGETVLSPRGVAAVTDRLGIPDIVAMDATDAELVSEGEISSLDDAQVAAQRIFRRGARAVLIKCGPLPSRHFGEGGDGSPHPVASDLFYDGKDFTLYEAPHLEGRWEGASSAHSIALMCSLLKGSPVERGLQDAKAYVTESIRRAEKVGDSESISFFWQRHASG